MPMRDSTPKGPQGLIDAILPPFGAAQIRNFVERWYAYMGQARGLSSDAVRGRAQAGRPV
jgi:hypothetical protein